MSTCRHVQSVEASRSASFAIVFPTAMCLPWQSQPGPCAPMAVDGGSSQDGDFRCDHPIVLAPLCWVEGSRHVLAAPHKPRHETAGPSTEACTDVSEQLPYSRRHHSALTCTVLNRNCDALCAHSALQIEASARPGRQVRGSSADSSGSQPSHASCRHGYAWHPAETS